jgi:hypothetical protein
MLLKNLLIETQDTKIHHAVACALGAKNDMQNMEQQALQHTKCKFEQENQLIGKDEVGGSNPPSSSTENPTTARVVGFFYM